LHYIFGVKFTFFTTLFDQTFAGCVKMANHIINEKSCFQFITEVKKSAHFLRRGGGQVISVPFPGSAPEDNVNHSDDLYKKGLLSRVYTYLEIPHPTATRHTKNVISRRTVNR